jgi:DNA-binding transcriptional regulator YiaG
MNCDKCGVAMSSKMATERDPYRYNLGGGFLLWGIRVYRCPQCRAEAPLIPAITDLHSLMAQIIARKTSLLNGAEVQFLRKNAGLSSKDCAEALGLTATYLSHVENNSAKIGAPADRLIRLLGTGTPTPKEELMRLAAAMRTAGKAPPRRATHHGKNGWKPAA